MKINLSQNILSEVTKNKDKCIDCKKCYSVCPMMKSYSSSPKLLMKDIINEKSLNKDIPYSCMLCDACNNVCPRHIDLKSMFYSLRKEAFNKKLKPNNYKTIKFHQVNSFSNLFSTSLRINTKKIFLPGCSLTSYSSDIVKKTFDYLNETLGDISLVIKCCGKPTESIGDTEQFEKYYLKLDNLLKENNVEEVIVACPSCLNTIRKYSENIKVTPIWNIIDKFGIPKHLINHYVDTDIIFTLHDPCPMRNEFKVHNNVRQILNNLGVKFEEFENNRNNSECCGLGGMAKVTSPNISNSQTTKRASDAKTNTVISYCESCCEAMLMANKNALHILDFLFNEDVINKFKFTQEQTSVLNKWSERYKGVKISKSEAVKNSDKR